MDISPMSRQPDTQFQLCQCVFEILSTLGADIGSAANDVCVGEGEGNRVPCESACLTDNSSCSLSEICAHDASNHVDVCHMYQNNKTLDDLVTSLHVILTNMDCKTVSQRLKSTCANILCKKTT